MRGDVAAAARHRIVVLLGPEIVGHRRGEHVVARQSDVVERVVAGLVWSLELGLLPGDVLDRTRDVGPRFRHAGGLVVARRPPAAGRIAIDLGDAVLVEIDREGVGKPRRAGIAPGRVAGPPGDPDRSAQLAAPGPEYASEFEHRRVASGIVADADVP